MKGGGPSFIRFSCEITDQIGPLHSNNREERLVAASLVMAQRSTEEEFDKESRMRMHGKSLIIILKYLKKTYVP